MTHKDFSTIQRMWGYIEGAIYDLSYKAERSINTVRYHGLCSVERKRKNNDEI